MVAISGELPANQLNRLPGGRAYKANITKGLKQKRLLLTYYKNGLRGYRLTAPAKTMLLADNPERFSFFLTGSTGTNHIKSETTSRLRLHRISEATVTMMGAGVSSYRDEKTPVFSPNWGEDMVALVETPAFYSSREIKELGTEFVKIRSARAVGVLLAEETVYVVYNMGAALMKWNYKSEMRTKALMKTVLCRERLSSLYAPDAVRGLALGDSMELAYALLTNSGGKNYFILDGSYEDFYFLTNDRHGECLLRLLCDSSLNEEVQTLLSAGLGEARPGWAVENDAFDGEHPVLFGYLCNLPRIMRFDTALRLRGEEGSLICFDFQSEALRHYCGKQVEIQTIDFDKLEGRFFL
ncbi:MAG: hypothetical protein PHY23_00910 [Oscillospiraceae bacterium]|nr:hypothetical protein [Oscillospiraceae bacterium]